MRREKYVPNGGPDGILVAEAGNVDNPERQALIEAEFAYKILEAKCAKYDLAMTSTQRCLCLL
jgi:GTPase involved in cell partitioning and DNA repair